ncbi:restriction endonuclease subunit S [Roseateles koreensis]|uniref:Restriction endonuclease subunit S n=1 Tax=Roseateles koreensis TaxID=2987526 RepID=A0ABT5KTP4_9BURK|nr:restriction endonuclease subunit S [Roseateles koreensis]MDC8786299.1 restriction endonuclease subunit S [Roseateles koreensis]
MKNERIEAVVGHVPASWAIQALESLADFITKGGTPTTYGHDWADEATGVPFLRSECVTDNGFNAKGMNFISAAAHRQMSRSEVKPGDLLMTITGNVGRVAKAPERYTTANINQHIARIRVLGEASADVDYVYQCLKHDGYATYYRAILTGQAYPQISLQQVRGTPIALPPLHEQRKISAILTAMDDKLDVIARQIEATQTLKQGLMQTLFSRGVGTRGADGRWVQHVEFKASELGSIPMTWDVRSLNEVVDNLDRQRIPLKQADRALRRGAYPYYGASGVIDWIDGFIFDGDFILLGEDGENVLSRNLPLAFRATGKIWVNNHAHVFRPKTGCDIQFLVELLESIDYSSLASGTAQPKITQQALNQLRFAMPPYEEQQRIGSILATAESKLASLRLKQANYGTLKRGLMQKLLTGEWRINADASMAV